MRCPECDTEINDNAEYCPNCGTPIVNPNNNDNKNPRLGKGLVAFIIVGTLFLVVFGILYYSNHKNDPEYTQTAIEPDSNLIENTISKYKEAPKDTVPADSVNKQEDEQAEKVFNSIRKQHRSSHKVKIHQTTDDGSNAGNEGAAAASEGSQPAVPSRVSTDNKPHIEPIGNE